MLGCSKVLGNFNLKLFFKNYFYFLMFLNSTNEGSTPGNPRATHGLSRGFVAKACPARGALEHFCVFGKMPRGHSHGICT